ncbi:MAG: hypothetical protein K8R39_10700 [Arcobacteraceae bacterium]|nr:hypothetical protein [Arcobacteraceae bacterium]
MTIKYAGPRPEISHHGIQFKDGKEDKYVYLIIAIQILKAIDKDYEEKKSYSYDTKTKRFTDAELLDIMNTYEPNLKETVMQEEIRYEEHLQEEIAHVKQRKDLKEIERDTWIENLNIMQQYRIQRAVNKIYYIHCVADIAKVIKREKIKEIDTPFYEKYWHVLQTIQGTLSEGRDSVGSDLKVENTSEGMIAKMFVNY